MKLPDGLLIALNAFLLAFAFVGFASVDEDTLMVGAVLAMATAVVNGVVMFRRRDREPTPRRARRKDTTDELDVHQVLDLDARLEVLERAQSDAADAARWRALVESGQASAPAADAPVAQGTGPGATIQNGQ